MTTTISKPSKLLGRLLRILVISDIHLGHPNTPTLEMIANLKAAIPDNAETAEIDMIVLAGDVFDSLLSLSGDDIWEIKIWVNHLLRLCKKHDIVLRVLEGTPSHDWKQSQLFPFINKIAKIGTDLKYVKDLSIEYIERFGITVLYVPDEWAATTDHTLSQVHDLLRENNLTQVDYAFMHGSFDFQIPKGLNLPHHCSAAYLMIVKEHIFIGHEHTFSQFQHITAQGSFDRTAHGQEEPKGHVRFTRFPNGEKSLVFVETENAKKYVTVRCLGMNLDQTLEEVGRRVSKLPPGSFVRVESETSNPVFANMMMLSRHWPTFHWTKLPRGIDAQHVEVIDDTDVYVPITLTKDNLADQLMDRLVAAAIPKDILAIAATIMKEVI